jgi:hypothetical protein
MSTNLHELTLLFDDSRAPRLAVVHLYGLATQPDADRMVKQVASIFIN